MIDRSYLPFQSAREHKDRGMAKWMGFFLSEHTTSLVDERNKVDLSTDLTMADKLMLLGQLYVGKLRARLVVKSKQQRLSLYGEVSEYRHQIFPLKLGWIPNESILMISCVSI